MYELSVLKGYSFDCDSDLMSLIDPSQKAAVADSSNKRNDEVSIVNHIFLRNCSIDRRENPCLSNYQLNMVSLAAFDYTYEEKSRRGDADKYLNVFEDGSLKKSDNIYIIDELLRSKQLYQDPDTR